MPEQIPEAATKLNPIRTLAGVLIHPRRAMVALNAAPRRWWWVPLLITLAALVFRGAVYARADHELMYQHRLAWFESMPETEKGPGTEPPTRTDPHPLTVWLPIGARAVGTLITWLLWAGLVALATTFLGHNGAKFGATFAMVAWAKLPFAVRSVVQGIAMSITGRAIYNQGLSGLVLDSTPQAPNLSFGPRPYVPPARGTAVLAALLGQIDVYVIWSLALTAAGVWAFAHMPKRRAWLITMGIWILATAAGLIPSLLGMGANLF